MLGLCGNKHQAIWRHLDLDAWQYVGKLFLHFALTLDILIYWDPSLRIRNLEKLIGLKRSLREKEC